METKTILIISIVIAVVIWSLWDKKYLKVEAFESKEQKVIDIEQGRITIPPMVEEKNKGILMGASEFDGLPDEILPAWGTGATSTTGIMAQNNCSKACCSPQYPVPFDNIVDRNVGDTRQYIQSNINCYNDWQDSGCLCMTKEQAMLMANRGGNTVDVMGMTIPDTRASPQSYEGRAGNSVV